MRHPQSHIAEFATKINSNEIKYIYFRYFDNRDIKNTKTKRAENKCRLNHV